MPMRTVLKPLQIRPSVSLQVATAQSAASVRPRSVCSTVQSIMVGKEARSLDSGTAGGPVYGGVISYFPTAVWTIDLLVDILTNVSNLTAAPTQGAGLGGLPLVGAAFSVNKSVQVTTVALRSNYAFSPQTSIFGVLSDARIQFIDSPRLDSSWFASVGIQHRLSDQLSLTGNFSYTNYSRPSPLLALRAIWFLSVRFTISESQSSEIAITQLITRRFGSSAAFTRRSPTMPFPTSTGRRSAPTIHSSGS